MTMLTKLIKKTWPSLLVLGFLAACDEPEQTGSSWTIDPKATTTPAGEELLLGLADENQVTSAIDLANTAIDGHRALGIELFGEALKEELARRHIVADDVLNELTPPKVLSSKLPSYWSPAVASQTSALGQQKLALGLNTPEYVTYYECPLNVPERTSDSCDTLIEAALKVLVAKAEEAKQTTEQVLDELYPNLNPESKKFVLEWAGEALQVGSDIAAVNAKFMLAAAAKCSTKLTADEIAYQLGMEQGISLLAEGSEVHTWADAQVKGCTVNVDEITVKAQAQAQLRVEGFISKNPVCEDEDISKVNAALVRAEGKRKEGMLAGIKIQTQVLRSELFSLRSNACCTSTNLTFGEHPWEGTMPTKEKMWGDGTCATDAAGWSFRKLSTPASGYSYQGSDGYNYPGSLMKVDLEKVEMCCRFKDNIEVRCVANERVNGRVRYAVKWGSNEYWTWSCEHKHVGSPLVIDLDDDGLNMSDARVAFDLLATGGAQCRSWVGPREGLLALDVDGNGRIDSGRELFGNYTACGERTCFDGVDALAAWDQVSKGGNADGRIDKQDAVYTQLRLWTDVDQDGASQPAELSTLAERGVLALDLEAERGVVHGEHGAVSARMRVLTTEGFRTAHDIWFKLGLKPADLASLLPKH